MDLEKLRLLNQDLLQKLRANQEEFKKRIRLQLASPSSPSSSSSPGGEKATFPMENKGEKENRGPFPNASRTVSAEERQLRMEKPGLGSSSSNPSPSRNGGPSERQIRSRLDPGSPGAKVVLVPSSSEAPKSLETGPTAEKGPLRKDPRKPPVPSEEPSSGEKPGEAPTETRASVRMPQNPKSILLTPGSKEKAKKESGRVTFVSDPTEGAIPADAWSVRPFLGYDWIAGLLDAGPTSVAEKPDRYFSELQEFRRANRDACVYDRDPWTDDPASSSARDRGSETDPVSHQCVFCYRLNKRLFPEPLRPGSACPVCKNPRNRRPPETLLEPAFVRVSIPRSTLLPAYKRKIHRRKSYEPADDLALPSHCLAGWENPLPALSPNLSSLDLGSSLNPEPDGRFSKKISRVSGGTRTDELLDRSRAAQFELGSVARRRRRHQLPFGKTN